MNDQPEHTPIESIVEEVTEDLGKRLANAVKNMNGHHVSKRSLNENLDPKESQERASQNKYEKIGKPPLRQLRLAQPNHPKIKRMIDRMKNNPGTSVFYGANGVGKTSYAASVWAAWNAGHAMWTDTFTFTEEIKATFDTKAKWRIPMHSLLILDEFEKIKGGDWVHTCIDATIRRRHDEEKHTIIITNLSEKDVREHLTGAVCYRVDSTGEFLEMKKPWWETQQ